MIMRSYATTIITRRQALPARRALHFTRASAPYTAHALTRSFAALLGQRPLLTTKLPYTPINIQLQPKRSSATAIA